LEKFNKMMNEEFETQLLEVKQLLEIDPNNEELHCLKTSLEELIELRSSLEKGNDAKSSVSVRLFPFLFQTYMIKKQ
jgi:hypothetical protein